MDLEFKQILILLKKRVWVLLISIMLFFILGVTISTFIIPPTYKSDVKLIVYSNKQQQDRLISISDIEVNSKLGETYSEIVKSKNVLENIIKELKLNISYNDLYNNIQIENINQTGIIKISVKGKEANTVHKIANEIPKALNKEIDEIFSIQSISIIENPDIAKKPISPNKPLIIFVSCVMGGFIGLTSIFYYEYLDKKIRYKNGIRSIEGIDIIGKIEKIKYKNQSKDKTTPSNSNINSNFEEIYKEIIKNVEFSNIDKKIKTILLTSFNKKEGKTLIVSNLAISLSKLKKKILLIDLNLINPNIDKQLNIENIKNLLNCLVNHEPIEECIVKTYIDNMDVLLAGDTSSKTSEILNSCAIKTIINQLKDSYDYILIDSPAIDEYEDAAIISSYIDSVIVICTDKKVKISQLLKIKNKLNIQEKNIIGIIFNKVQSSRKIN